MLTRSEFFRENIIRLFDEIGFTMRFGKIESSLSTIIEEYDLNDDEQKELLLTAVDLLENQKLVSLVVDGDVMSIGRFDSDKYRDVFMYVRNNIEGLLTEVGQLKDYKVNYLNIKEMENQIKTRQKAIGMKRVK